MRVRRLKIMVVLLLCSCTLLTVACESSETSGDGLLGQLAGEKESAQDANAKALVRNAMTVAETAYVDLRTFDPAVMTPDFLTQIEPTIVYNAVTSHAAATAPTSDAAWDGVDYWGDEWTYAIGSRSESGTAFGVIVDKSPSATGNDFYVNGQVGDWSVQLPPTLTESTSTVALARRFGDTVSVWGMEITVSAPEVTDDPTVALFVDEDKQVQVVLVTIANISTKDHDYNLFYWEGKDQDYFIYDASVYLQDQALGSGAVPAGQTVRGYVGFELPKGVTLASVTYAPMGFRLVPEYMTWGQ